MTNVVEVADQSLQTANLHPFCPGGKSLDHLKIHPDTLLHMSKSLNKLVTAVLTCMVATSNKQPGEDKRLRILSSDIVLTTDVLSYRKARLVSHMLDVCLVVQQCELSLICCHGSSCKHRDTSRYRNGGVTQLIGNCQDTLVVEQLTARSGL